MVDMNSALARVGAYNDLLGQARSLLSPRALDLIANEQCYSYLKALFQDFIANTPYQRSTSKNDSKIVWWMWLQGVENAPPIVKTCLDSIKKHFFDYNITIITNRNLGKLIEIPHFILEKHTKKLISNAHFSDIVRTLLLEKYGGIWIDATVYCTGRTLIENGVFNKPLFFMKYIRPNPFFREMDNWILSSCKHNCILQIQKKLLIEYWKINNHAITYFIYHIFFKIALEFDNNLHNDIPTYSCFPSFILHDELFNPYSKDRLNQIYTMTDFHKLTYKFTECATNDSNIETMYSYLIRSQIDSDS